MHLIDQLDNSGCKIKTIGGVKTQAILQGLPQMQLANIQESFHQTHLYSLSKVLVSDGVRVEGKELMQWQMRVCQTT